MANSLLLDYIKERKQFGVPIGSFQALQHRAAYVFISVTLAHTAFLAAASAVDTLPDQIQRLASLAKVKTTHALEHAAKAGVQMHGGVGVTDEYDIGLYLKRARAAECLFAAPSWHINRWASLKNY